MMKIVSLAMLALGAASAHAALVGFEAESGTLGTDWAVSNSASPAYITITTTGTNNNPGTVARVASYTVNFPAADTYQLYARVNVGTNTFNDDSMFYAASFGSKDPTLNSDWILVNGLATGGFSNKTDVVTGGGTLGSSVWKWINLSQFTSQPGFTVSAGNLTQTFQIGAREDGLSIDKFVFGSAALTFTVSNLDNGTDGSAAPPPTPKSATIDTTKVFQTIEGMGGATAFYQGWLRDHPFKQEIYTNVFAGLNLSMLRLGDWYRYQTPIAGFDTAATDIVSNANRLLGHPVQVYMSSWAPPGFLKSNGQVGSGGTLLFTNGSFAYTDFAQYWYDSINAYQSNGVNLKWISIQNEPDWAADYDSCVFHPNEDTVNGTNYASYSKALDAVYQKISTLSSPPKILGPEVVGIGFNDVQNYAAPMHAASFYGVNHHLYGGSTDGSPDGYRANLIALTNVFPTKPKFMTEFGFTNMMDTANIMHDCFVWENAVGFNFWSLVWPTHAGLVNIENPYANHSTWTNAPPGTPTQSHGWWYAPSYWAMKHFSYYIQPGFKRVNATNTDSNVRLTGWISPDNSRLVVVLINTNKVSASVMNFNLGAFNGGQTAVYQTWDTNYYQSLGALTNNEYLPPQSITTVVVDQIINVGSAANPSPTNGTTAVPLTSALNWAAGSNAVTHALYLGTDSNAVANATPSSPLFQGNLTTTNDYPPINGSTTYFWRVDEIFGINTNTGSVWYFTTVPTPALGHRYSFTETAGNTIADSLGGPAWTGTLPNSGTFSSGQLTLTSNLFQYASLPPGIVSTLSKFTALAWINLTSTANWARAFDFGNSTTTYMFLAPQNGTTGKLRYSITTNSTASEQQINCNTALTTGAWHQLAVTQNTNFAVLYVDGVPVGTNNNLTLNPSKLGVTTNNYLGKSQWNDPYLNSQWDEFRLYNVALSPDEIAASYALGTDAMFSTNSPGLNLQTSGTNLNISWPVANPGFTLQYTTDLISGIWTSITPPSPPIIGTNYQLTIPATNGNIYLRLIK
jgi:glucuronoarabinoxylan endo-1,4-beta-xylanase